MNFVVVFPLTCEKAAVVLLHFLSRLKLLLGMFLREFVPQVQRVPLLSEDTFGQQDLVSQPSEKLTSSVTSLVLKSPRSSMLTFYEQFD